MYWIMDLLTHFSFQENEIKNYIPNDPFLAPFIFL